jgi:hypothetical protein
MLRLSWTSMQAACTGAAAQPPVAVVYLSTARPTEITTGAAALPQSLLVPLLVACQTLTVQPPAPVSKAQAAASKRIETGHAPWYCTCSTAAQLLRSHAQQGRRVGTMLTNGNSKSCQRAPSSRRLQEGHNAAHAAVMVSPDRHRSSNQAAASTSMHPRRPVVNEMVPVCRRLVQLVTLCKTRTCKPAECLKRGNDTQCSDGTQLQGHRRSAIIIAPQSLGPGILLSAAQLQHTASGLVSRIDPTFTPGMQQLRHVTRQPSQVQASCSQTGM